MAIMIEPDEPPPFRVLRPDAASRFLLTADHAGNLIPRRLANLGVSEAERGRHIGWDIGIAGVTEVLSALLGAPAVFQVYSRLVIDCNRRPDVASAFPVISEMTPIPGNVGLDKADKDARRQAIFDPYHQAIDGLIAARRAQGRTPIYVAMHSFTPIYQGVPRPMDVAVLYHRRPRLSRALAGLLVAEGELVVAENEPYSVSDETDYGVPVHAEHGDLDYVEIEIRQDLIETPEGQAEWGRRLARLLPRAVAMLDRATA
ncbi:MAG: N-formylglutamate amidohydrolase [Acidiphilium sp.]|nr:N-formylglutamate amidohydrolase [Acidiphilium sp.]MDD4936104.1 N-formylglutamate amidohydrolase [Acidiphilium sp.]